MKEAHNMELEAALRSVPVEEWVTRQAIVFDWFDGPREGVCALARPACEFAFDLLGERASVDALDDRLFRVDALATGSIELILALLANLGQPTNPVWVPIWRFSDDTERQRVDIRLDEVLAARRRTDLVIHTRDMIRFLGCWSVTPRADGVGDWFSLLGVTSGPKP
jgi:hypothetical protein